MMEAKLYFKNKMAEEEVSSQILERITELAYNTFKEMREEERLNPSEVQEFKERVIKPMYPHKREDNGEARDYGCCQAFSQSPGTFWCCSSTAPDPSFCRFGLAICLYMKFVKHVNCVYLLLALLAITSCGVCVAVAVDNNFDPLLDYQTFFYSTSIGAFSSRYMKCDYSTISSSTNQASLVMSCPSGKVNGSIVTGTGIVPAVLTNQSLNSLYNCRNERKTLQSGLSLASPFLAGSSATTVSYSNSNSAAAITLTFSGTQQQKLVVFVYECYDNIYNLGKLNTTSDNLLYYVVSIDLLVIFIFLFFFWSEVKAEEEEIKYFRLNQVGLHDFSVEIEGIKRNQLEKGLNRLFTEMIDSCGYDFKKSLVVFTIPEVEEEVEQREYRRELYLKFYDLLNKYYFRESDHLMEFKDCHDIVTTELSEEDYAEFQRKLRKYIKELFAMKRGHVIKESTDATEVYLVFDNVLTREKMMACQKRNCCRESILLDQDEPDESEFHLKEPPVPDMIDWQNRYKWTKLRTVFSWFIVLIICLACYLFFGFVQYQESQLNSTYNYDIDCTVLYSGVDLTVYSASLQTADKSNYLTCYCQDKSLLDVASAQQSFCSAWQKEYLTYKIIPLLISLGIVIVNVIVGQIFRVLSAFECQKNAQDEQTSYAFKRGFLLIMNMGIIMILLNFNYNNSTQLQEVSFIFMGKYNDFTSDWYGNIGGIIVLTMVFNITFSLVELLFACFISCIKKCWDTRCCILSTSRPTKQEYIALFSDEIYPIGERYAYLMATFFISMIFSGVIPILVPVTLISFVFLYFADKLLFFKYYQTPIQYRPKLQKAFLSFLYISVMLHFGLTAFFLAEPSLIASGAYFGSYSSVSSGNGRVDNMFRTGYILPYSIMFILMLVYAVFQRCIGGVFSACMDKCKGRLGNYKSTMVQKMKLMNIMSPEQRASLRLALEVNLRKLELKRKERARSMTDLMAGNMGRGKVNTIRESQRPAVDLMMQEEEILKSSLEQLTEAEKNEGGKGQKLLGLPSYEECVKSNSEKKDDELMRFQRRLRSLLFSGIEPGTSNSLPKTGGGVGPSKNHSNNKSTTALNKDAEL